MKILVKVNQAHETCMFILPKQTFQVVSINVGPTYVDYNPIHTIIYCKTRIFSVYKFLSKHCQRAIVTSIFRKCVTVKNINKSNNIKMLLEMQLPHEEWGNQWSCFSNYSASHNAV